MYEKQSRIHWRTCKNCQFSSAIYHCRVHQTFITALSPWDHSTHSHPRQVWRHAPRRVMVGSMGMPLYPLDHFRFSVCHTPFAPFQCRIVDARDRMCPRILSKNNLRNSTIRVTFFCHVIYYKFLVYSICMRKWCVNLTARMSSAWITGKMHWMRIKNVLSWSI